MSSGWIKYVAIFMAAFALFDVCAPEACTAQLPALARSSTQVQANQPDADDQPDCAFEEDCFACAHLLAGANFVLQYAETVSFAEAEPYFSTLDGALSLPYHPPRA